MLGPLTEENISPIEYGQKFDRGKMLVTTIAGQTYYILQAKPTQEQPDPSYYISEHMGPGIWKELPQGNYQGLSEAKLVAALTAQYLNLQSGITATLLPIEV